MSSCAASCSICCRVGSCASGILVSLPAAVAAHCCRSASKRSPPFRQRRPRQQSHQRNRYSFFPSGFAHCAAVPWPSSNDLRLFRSGSVLHQRFMLEPKRNRRSNIQRLSERARFVCAHSSHSNHPRFSLHCRACSKPLASDPHRSITSCHSCNLQFINIRTAVLIPQPQLRPIQNP